MSSYNLSNLPLQQITTPIIYKIKNFMRNKCFQVQLFHLYLLLYLFHLSQKNLIKQLIIPAFLQVGEERMKGILPITGEISRDLSLEARFFLDLMESQEILFLKDLGSWKQRQSFPKSRRFKGLRRRVYTCIQKNLKINFQITEKDAFFNNWKNLVII